MKENNEYVFTTAPVSRAVLSLVIPTVISQLITVIYNMADTFFIGQMNDPDRVAAVTIVMPVFMLTNSIANLFGIGGASLISRCLGRGDREKAGRTSAFCIFTAGFTAFCYGILVLAVRGRILPVLGANRGSFDYAYRYLFWTLTVGAVPTVMNVVLAHLVRSEGYSRQAAFGVAMGGILNMALDPVFIFLFGMKVAGAAIATMLSNFAAMVYFSALIFKNRKNTVILPRISNYTLGEGIPAEVFTVGLPSFAMSLMGSLSNTVLNHIVASYSNEAIAGMGIAKKIDMVVFSVAQGMTRGALPLIGYNFSAGNYKRMTDSIKTVTLYSMTIALGEMAALFFFAGPLTSLFIRNRATVAHGRTFLKIIALACPFTTLNCLVITTFQATGRKVQPLILSMIRKGGGDIPMMIIFNAAFGVGGIAWATPLAEVVGIAVAACLFIPFLKKLRRPRRA